MYTYLFITIKRLTPEVDTDIVDSGFVVQIIHSVVSFIIVLINCV